MSDSWENNYFGSLSGSKSTASDSSPDADSDGYTDLEEFLNGTNPVEGLEPPDLIGDLNNDGRDELIIGAPMATVQ